MQQGRVGRRLGRSSSHRLALLRSLTTSLFKYEKIVTTDSKAKELRRFAENLITTAKKGGISNIRQVARDIKDENILNKLFQELAPRFGERKSGYTRIIKLGPRKGDRANMALVSLLLEEAKDKKKKKGKK